MKFSERELLNYKLELASIIGLKEKLNYLRYEFSYYDANHYNTDQDKRYDNPDTSIVKDWFRREIEQINRELDRKELSESKRDNKPTGKIKKKQETNYEEKFYALSDLILKAAESDLSCSPIDPKSKRSIIEYGSRKYGTGEMFYRAWKNDINLSDLPFFLKTLKSSHRKGTWKEIVKEITGNDLEVLKWLKDKPD
jgi:hypothetical protein